MKVLCKANKAATFFYEVAGIYVYVLLLTLLCQYQSVFQT